MKSFRPLDLGFVLKQRRPSGWDDVRKLAHTCRLGLLVVMGFLFLAIDWDQTSLFVEGGLVLLGMLLLVPSVGHRGKR